MTLPQSIKDPLRDKIGKRSLHELKSDLRALDTAIRILQEERRRLSLVVDAFAYATWQKGKDRL